MEDEYNHSLCEERHKTIEKDFKKMDGRLGTVEKRFFAFLMLLIGNLIGVIVTLTVLIAKL